MKLGRAGGCIATGPFTSPEPRPGSRVMEADHFHCSWGIVATGKRLFRAFALFVIALLLLCGGCTAWLLRDPVPRIMERHGSIDNAVVEPLGSDAGHTNSLVRVRSTTGLEVQMMLRAPDSGADSAVRRPVFLILGGYRTGDRAATLIPDTHGNIVAALSYPYEGDLGVKGLAVLPAVPGIRSAILDTPSAVMLAIDYLLSIPEVDSSRIELVGASFGAPFAVIAGALDERVSRVWSLHGAAWPYRQIELNLRDAIPSDPVRKTVAALANIFASGPRFDPIEWAPRISPRPFIMINAREDERMPRDAVEALYAAASEPKDQIWLDGQHMQSNRREIIAGLVRTVMERARY